MRSMTVKYRILAPALLAVATLLIGGFLGTRPTESADWENVNLQEVDVTNFVIQPTHTACLLATPINATQQEPLTIECQDDASQFPTTGKLLIYNYEGKDTHKVDEELLQYDNTDLNPATADVIETPCGNYEDDDPGTEGVQHTEICIINRGFKQVFADQAMLLATPIDGITLPEVTFDVQSTKPEGETENLVPGDEIRIDKEQFLVTNVEKDPPAYPLHTITAVRAEKGTEIAPHDPGAKIFKKQALKSAHKGCTVAEEKLNPGCSSFVKWATQLTAPVPHLLPDGMTFDVESCEGFIPESGGYDEIMIGNERIDAICVPDGDPATDDTWTVTEEGDANGRGADCGPGNPTTAANHVVGDVVTAADTVSISLGLIDHNKGTNELSRRTITYNGCQVKNITKVAFAANHPFPKEQFPYDYAAPSPVTQTGSYDGAGQFTIALYEDCSELVPGVWLYVSQVVNLNPSKDPFAQHEGSITIILDVEEPYDCTGAGGHGRVHFERLAGKEDVSPADGIQDYLQFDSDGDRCPNYSELGASPNNGGARDPWNSWDYFEPTKNGQVRVNDIMEVVNRYGLDDGDPGYSTQYDRGGVVADGNAWNQLHPNGQIRVGDILGVVGSYGHDCP